MIRYISALLICSVILTGCGESRFEKEMRAAKDYLLEGKYIEAKSSLEIALIEEPNNKDALTLLKKADYYVDVDKKKKYIEEARSLNLRISEIASNITYPITEYMDPKDAEQKVNEVQKILNESESLNDIWSSDPETKDSVDSLNMSIKTIYNVFSILKEDVHEELVITNSGPDGLQSKYDKARAAYSSNDSVIRANIEFGYYSGYSKEFESKISTLENILDNK